MPIPELGARKMTNPITSPGPLSVSQPPPFAAIRERAESLIDPVWFPLGALLVGRRGDESRVVYDLKLAHWTIRLEYTAQAPYGPIVTLGASLRADSPLGRLRDVALNPIQGGWSPFFVRDLCTADDVLDALMGIRSEVQAVPEINRHLNRVYRLT
jgi:hypothetical protein